MAKKQTGRFTKILSTLTQSCMRLVKTGQALAVSLTKSRLIKKVVQGIDRVRNPLSLGFLTLIHKLGTLPLISSAVEFCQHQFQKVPSLLQQIIRVASWIIFLYLVTKYTPILQRLPFDVVLALPFMLIFIGWNFMSLAWKRALCIAGLLVIGLAFQYRILMLLLLIGLFLKSYGAKLWQSYRPIAIVGGTILGLTLIFLAVHKPLPTYSIEGNKVSSTRIFYHNSSDESYDRNNDDSDSESLPSDMEQDSADASVADVVNNDDKSERSSIETLTLRFRSHQPKAPSSVARLELLDSPNSMNQYIQMTPALEGTWRWSGESNLVFSPSQDWPAGTSFHVKLSPQLFRDDVRIDTRTYDFKTAPFTGSVESFSVYQDPQEMKFQRAVATLKFSHDVSLGNLNKAIVLKIGSRVLNTTITSDKFNRTVYVKSEPIALTDSSQYVKLSASDIVTTQGTARLSSSLSGEAQILDRKHFFRVNSLSSSILNDEQDQPMQVLFVNFTTGVDPKIVSEHVKAYLLPLEKKAKKNSEPVAEDSDSSQSDDEQDQPRSYAWSPSEVKNKPEVLKRSSPVKLTLLTNADGETTRYGFKYNVDDKARRYLYVSVDASLPSIGQFPFTETISVVDVPTVPRLMKIVGDGTLLSMHGDRKMTFVTRGVSSMKVSLSRILPDQVNHLISQSNGDFKHFSFKDPYEFNEENISQLFEKTIPLNPDSQKSNNYASVDLDPYLKQSSGLFVVEASAWNPKTKSRDSSVSMDKRLVLVTDMGMLIKRNRDLSHDVFVMSLANSRPLSGVTVRILGKNGLPLMKAETDSQGHVHFASVDGSEFKGAQQPTAFVATRDADLSFMPFDSYDQRVEYSRFDTGGDDYNSDTKQNTEMRAFLFSDRGLYRPGETLNLGVIVRQGSRGSSLAGVPVQMKITDPQYKEVLTKKFSLTPQGFSDLQWTVPQTAQTGYYTIDLSLIRGDKKTPVTIGSTSVNVAEFTPDALKIDTKILGGQLKGWSSPTNLSGSVTINNLFGAPAQDARVTANLEIIPTTLSFDDYQGYVFMDPLRDAKKKSSKSLTQHLSEETTDANGTATFDFDLKSLSSGTYRLIFTATGYEGDSGKGVTSVDSLTISPLKSLVGIHTDARLEYLTKGSNAPLSLIAIDSSLKQIALPNLKKRIVQQRYVSSLVKQANQTYKYQSVLKETEVSSERFSIAATGTILNLPTESSGNFYVEILNAQGERVSRTDYFVAGETNLSYSLERNAELKLQLQKSEWNPGDDIAMTIISPYAGAGLITIESDKVYATQWFRTTGTSSTQSIHIPDSFQGNGYVNVSFIRDMDSKEIFMSPHSYAVAPFSLSKEKARIHISLTPPALARPGEPMKVTYQADQSGQIVVYAVDEGILQVARYSTPAPLDFFFRKISLQVQTFQIVDMILPEFHILKELAGAGGSEGAQELLKRNLNPFNRQGVKPAIYWSGVLNVSEGKPGSITYTPPAQFNGTLRWMAVAANSSQLGVSSKTMVVRAPIILRPTAPLVVAPTDTFTVSLVVSNQVEGSGKKAALTVQASSSPNLKIVSESKQTLKLDEGQETRVKFKVKTLDGLGEGKLTFKASLGNVSVSSEATMSVRPATFFATTVMAQQGKTELVFKDFKRSLFAEFSDRKVYASDNPQVMLSGLDMMLEAYPYGCTEQIVSRAFPVLYQMNSRLGDAKKQNEMLQSIINTLVARQLSSGSFTLWDHQDDENVFASLYALNFLIDAKENGVSVPASLLARGQDWLQTFADRTPSSMEEARMQAFAIYLLTRRDVVTTAMIEHLLETVKAKKWAWKDDIFSVFLGTTYALMQRTSDGLTLINQFKLRTTQEDGDDYFMSNDTQNGQYAYLMAKHAKVLGKTPSDLKTIIPALLEAMLQGRITTLSSSYASIALGAYGASLSTTTPVTFKSKGVPLASTNTPFPTVTLTPETTTVTASTSSDAPLGLFGMLVQKGFEATPPTSSVKNGIEITREYLTDKGQPTTSATYGDTLTVRIHVRATGALKTISNVAIVDLLPGGFDLVRDSFSGYADSYDMREDRVLFYMTVRPNVSTFTYKVKPVAEGTFITPAIYAQAMYLPAYSAHSAGGSFKVSAP